MKFDPTALLISSYLDLCRGVRGDIFRDERIRKIHQLALAHVADVSSWKDVETLYLEATLEIIGSDCPPSVKTTILEIQGIAKERE